MHEQDMAIVKSLASVAWADGVFADAEREMVEALISAFEANDEEAKEIREFFAEKKTLDDIPLTELSTEDRRVLVQHAVLLSYVDGEQAQTEKDFIVELCKRLRIPDDQASEIVTAADARAKRFLSLL